MLHCIRRCGRTGARRFAAHDRLTTLRAWIWMLMTLRDYLGGPL